MPGDIHDNPGKEFVRQHLKAATSITRTNVAGVACSSPAQGDEDDSAVIKIFPGIELPTAKTEPV
ncbi:hypothetical protein ABH904_002181 [Pseudomonas frederiksbergensis]